MMVEYIKPKRIPEAQIQAEIYRQFCFHDISCQLEYRLPTIRGRVDIAVYRDKELKCLIEVKRCRKDHSRPDPSKLKQYQKYLKVGVPVFYCYGFQEISNIIYQVKGLL